MVAGSFQDLFFVLNKISLSTILILAYCLALSEYFFGPCCCESMQVHFRICSLIFGSGYCYSRVVMELYGHNIQW